MLYKAFISYSHAADGKLAPALQRSLHNIAKPWYRLRSMRVFRDETNLAASPGLWSKIEQALNQADYFVFLASPTAVSSGWVQKEVDWWLTNRSSQTFLIVLTDGAIHWDVAAGDFDWPSTTALPRSVAKAFAEEPLYIDITWARGVDQLSLRHSQFRAAVLNLAATLLDRPKDELDGDDVRQHRRTRRIAWSAAGVLAGLLVIASLTAWFAIQQGLVATSRSLAASSEAVLPTNPELALLLAHEALRYADGDQVDYALREAVLHNPETIIHHSQVAATLTARFLGDDLVVGEETDKNPVVWSVTTKQRRGALPSVANNWLRASSVVSDQSLVAVSSGEEVTLYDAARSKVLATLPGQGVRISHDGKVLTVWHEGKIQQWDLPSLQQHKVTAALPEGFSVLDVSADGSVLLLGEEGIRSAVIIAEALSGKVLLKLPERPLEDGSGLTPDGRFFVSQTPEETVFEVWNTSTGKKVRSLEQPSFGLGAVTYLAFSPDGKLFVCGDRSGAMHRWNLETGEWLGMEDSSHGVDIRAIEFSPDGNTMLSVAGDGSAFLWDVTTWRRIAALGGKGNEAWDVAFAPDSRHFLTTHRDGTIRIWDRETWYPSLTFSAGQAVAGEAGRLVAGTREDGRIGLWSTETGAMTGSLDRAAGDINAMALNKTGDLLALAPAKEPVELWNLATRQAAHRLAAPSADATSLAFSDDGSQLATGDQEGNLRLWGMPAASMRNEWRPAQSRITSIAIHPDGVRAAVATLEDGVFLQNLSTGKVNFHAGPSDDSRVWDVTLSPGGALLLVSKEKSAEVCDFSSLALKMALTGYSDEAISGAFSQSGRFLLSGSGNGPADRAGPVDGNAAYLWDMRSGRLLQTYLSAGDSVRMVSFVGDETRFITGSDDRLVRRYECKACLPLPELAKLATSRLGRALTDQERNQYLPQNSLLAWIGDHLPR
ncbi:TIR domain-containing protein [Mesorhizobium sp. GbtcB19]|uniref:WD40 domain-containing protein n=1 Tax=Mesorhizobium sp. GbtcB19 TaxID=2824764 RepID=UPI001C2FE4CE|nr:TIR domain-containing protein [Mesorhizobium sp. GbtcB19]